MTEMENRAVMKTASEAMRNKTSVTANTSGTSRSQQHHSSPLVSRVYHARMVCMNKYIQCAIDSLQDDVKEFQVLVLGCGYSECNSSAYTSTDAGACRTFLIDFDEIIQTRREANTQKENINTMEYLVGADLRDPELLLQKLKDGSPFNPLQPTIVIFESVLSYIKKVNVQALLTLLQRELPTCLTLIYDPLLTLSSCHVTDVCKLEELSQSMEATFGSRNVPLRFACRSTSAMRQFLHDCHFEHTLSMNMHQILTACFSNHSPSSSPSSSSSTTTAPAAQISSSLLGPHGEVKKCDDKDFKNTTCDYLHQQHHHHQQQQQQQQQGSTFLSHRAPTSLAEPFDEFASLAALHRIYSISCSCNSEELFDNFVHMLFDQNGNENDTENMIKKYTRRIRNINTINKINKLCGDSGDDDDGDSDITLQFQIREANSHDADVMAEMFTECHAEYVAKYKAVRAHIKHTRQLIYDTLAQQGDSKKTQQTNRYFYVAEDLKTHEVVGCVAFSYTSKPPVVATEVLSDTKVRGQLSHLCVDKQYRKRGLGSLLVEESVFTVSAQYCFYLISPAVASYAEELHVLRHARTVPYCEHVELTTLMDMQAARNLYQSKQFIEKDISSIGEGCQLVHMVR